MIDPVTITLDSVQLFAVVALIALAGMALGWIIGYMSGDD